METWDAIRSRRNVRHYADRPIAREDLERILEAGRRSPSAQNRQPWDFVVVTERDQLTELAKVWEGAGHVAESAATIGLIEPAGDKRHAGVRFDLGQATMSMMLAAVDLGIASAHALARDQELARKLLDLPEDRQLAYVIALGYPPDRPLAPIRRPDRREFDDVVHWGSW